MMSTQKYFDHRKPLSAIMPSSRSAGVVTNTVPTKIISTNVKMRSTKRAPAPNSSPMISGKLAPFFRMLIIPDI